MDSHPKNTALTIVVGFTLIYFCFKQEWALWLALSTGILALLSTTLAGIIHLLWMKLAQLLGLFMPTIVLSIFFFFFLTPIALIKKVFTKKDELLIRKRGLTSTFLTVNKSFNRNSFERTF